MGSCIFAYSFVIFTLGSFGLIGCSYTRNFVRQQKSQHSILTRKEMLGTIEGMNNVGHIITDCPIHVTHETGYFTYVHNSSSKNTVCGLYLMAEADQKIEVVFTRFDVPCENGGLVAFVDGWELNGEYFPSQSEHQLPIEDRISEFCGPKMTSVFVSSQNAALIQFRVNEIGKGFTVFIKHVRYPRPCNVVADTTTNDIAFTLRNYERRVNCTLIALYPCAVSVSAMKIMNREGSISRKCNILNKEDRVEIGGVHGLDTTSLDAFQNVCSERRGDIVIGCKFSAVKLISSGSYDNTVSVRIRQINDNILLDNDILIDDAIICDL